MEKIQIKPNIEGIKIINEAFRSLLDLPGDIATPSEKILLSIAADLQDKFMLKYKKIRKQTKFPATEHTMDLKYHEAYALQEIIKTIEYLPTNNHLARISLTKMRTDISKKLI